MDAPAKRSDGFRNGVLITAAAVVVILVTLGMLAVTSLIYLRCRSRYDSLVVLFAMQTVAPLMHYNMITSTHCYGLIAV